MKTKTNYLASQVTRMRNIDRHIRSISDKTKDNEYFGELYDDLQKEYQRLYANLCEYFDFPIDDENFRLEDYIKID